MHADYLAKLADAAEDGDWRCALAIAISLSPPIKVAELVSAPLIALRLSRVAMHAGYALNRELVRLFSHEFETTPVPVESFPPRLCETVFTAARRRLHESLEMARWCDAAAFLHLLLLLPAATSTRKEHLISDLSAIVNRMADEQQDRLDAPMRTPWQKNTPAPALDSIPRLFSIVAQSDYYPELARCFLLELLAHAEKPILQRIDSATVLIAWPDLMRLVQNRSDRRALTESAREWLERATALDPEPYAPEEFDDGENS